MKLLVLQHYQKSWIYCYGYCIALLKNPACLYFVCQYCHEHTYIDTGYRGVFKTMRLPSAAARHLEEQRPGRGYHTPGKALVSVQDSLLCYVLKNGTTRVTQAVASELSGVITQRFRFAPVGWLVKNNHPTVSVRMPPVFVCRPNANFSGITKIRL
jgi:hypothetical protein